MEEIWKDIPGYKGLYQVSNLGRIKSMKRYTKIPNAIRIEKEKILKLGKRNGYYSNTKERYITYRKSTNRYRITIDKKEYKSCKTLEEAIKKRDEILNGKT